LGQYCSASESPLHVGCDRSAGTAVSELSASDVVAKPAAASDGEEAYDWWMAAAEGEAGDAPSYPGLLRSDILSRLMRVRTADRAVLRGAHGVAILLKEEPQHLDSFLSCRGGGTASRAWPVRVHFCTGHDIASTISGAVRTPLSAGCVESSAMPRPYTSCIT